MIASMSLLSSRGLSAFQQPMEGDLNPVYTCSSGEQGLMHWVGSGMGGRDEELSLEVFLSSPAREKGAVILSEAGAQQWSCLRQWRAALQQDDAVLEPTPHQVHASTAHPRKEQPLYHKRIKKLYHVNRGVGIPCAAEALFKSRGHKMRRYFHSTAEKGVSRRETFRNGDS